MRSIMAILCIVVAVFAGPADSMFADGNVCQTLAQTPLFDTKELTEHKFAVQYYRGWYCDESVRNQYANKTLDAKLAAVYEDVSLDLGWKQADESIDSFSSRVCQDTTQFSSRGDDTHEKVIEASKSWLDVVKACVTSGLSMWGEPSETGKQFDAVFRYAPVSADKPFCKITYTSENALPKNSPKKLRVYGGKDYRITFLKIDPHQPSRVSINTEVSTPTGSKIDVGGVPFAPPCAWTAETALPLAKQTWDGYDIGTLAWGPKLCSAIKKGHLYEVSFEGDVMWGGATIPFSLRLCADQLQPDSPTDDGKHCRKSPFQFIGTQLLHISQTFPVDSQSDQAVRIWLLDYSDSPKLTVSPGWTIRVDDLTEAKVRAGATK
ncbi:MAG TPA: hypothetical protein VKV95_11420 [Terriglobia bacterium]|nr:hypothetical protein [Terriglobia bacterium]